jgi:hypothetical protein
MSGIDGGTAPQERPDGGVFQGDGGARVVGSGHSRLVSVLQTLGRAPDGMESLDEEAEVFLRISRISGGTRRSVEREPYRITRRAASTSEPADPFLPSKHPEAAPPHPLLPARRRPSRPALGEMGPDPRVLRSIDPLHQPDLLRRSTKTGSMLIRSRRYSQH